MNESRNHDVLSDNEITRDTLVLVLAGGQGSRLHELTTHRAKPAVHFGGSWRMIDFTLSNCLNAGLHTVGILTQYQAASLHHHLEHAWPAPPVGELTIDLLPASQAYQGTADAVRQNLTYLKEYYKTKYILILAGDHIYTMDYRHMLQDHIRHAAGCTVACIEVARQEASQFGILAADENWQVQSFVEKPADPPCVLGKPDVSLASMGIYVFDTDYLYDLLTAPSAENDHDFGHDILPRVLQEGRLYAHSFEHSCTNHPSDGHTYWRDVGTLDSYWQAHMDLLGNPPELQLFDPNWVIHAAPAPDTPPHLHPNSTLCDTPEYSLIGSDCTLSDAYICSSVLSHGVTIEEGTSIQAAVILPDVHIGKHCRLKNCIVERGCILPDGLSIGFQPTEDARYFRLSSSGKVVLVTPDMLAKYAEDTERQPKCNTPIRSISSAEQYRANPRNRLHPRGTARSRSSGNMTARTRSFASRAH